MNRKTRISIIYLRKIRQWRFAVPLATITLMIPLVLSLHYLTYLISLPLPLPEPTPTATVSTPVDVNLSTGQMTPRGLIHLLTFVFCFPPSLIISLVIMIMPFWAEWGKQ